MSRNGLSNASFEPLPNKEYAPLHAPIIRLEDAEIVTEIAARLIEWRSKHLVQARPLEWLLKLSMLAQDNPDALWLYLSIQSGDLSTLTETFQHQAEQRHLSRQEMHMRHKEALRDMGVHFPELQRTIEQLDYQFRPARGKHGHTSVDSQGTSQAVPS